MAGPQGAHGGSGGLPRVFRVWGAGRGEGRDSTSVSGPDAPAGRDIGTLSQPLGPADRPKGVGTRVEGPSRPKPERLIESLGGFPLESAGITGVEAPSSSLRSHRDRPEDSLHAGRPAISSFSPTTSLSRAVQVQVPPLSRSRAPPLDLPLLDASPQSAALRALAMYTHLSPSRRPPARSPGRRTSFLRCLNDDSAFP